MNIILVVFLCLISFIVGGIACYFVFNKDIEDLFERYLDDACYECRYKELVEQAIDESDLPILNEIRKDTENGGHD